MSLPVVPNDGWKYTLEAYNGGYHLKNTWTKAGGNAQQPVVKPLKKYMVILAGQRPAIS